MAPQAAHVINYRVGNTQWEFDQKIKNDIKNVNKLNPSKLTMRVTH